jgi:hypothetical protein
MTRRVHLEIITCAATESDPEGDSEIACGNEGPFDVEQLTTYTDSVTCKRCLKRIQAASRRTNE